MDAQSPVKRQRRLEKDQEATSRSYLRGSARKKGTDSTFLYGCARTDNAMHAKSKRDFEVVRATYKKQGTGQCYDARPVPK